MLTTYLIYFFFFSFLGWIIDSGTRSIKNRKFKSFSYFKIPFSPIYGFGGTILFLFFKNINTYWPKLVIVGFFLLILVEYFGGVFSENILKEKLWDYSGSKFNIKGRVDLNHSFFWLPLTVLFYFFLFPFLSRNENFIELSSFWDLLIFIIFIIGLTIATYKKAKKKWIKNDCKNY